MTFRNLFIVLLKISGILFLQPIFSMLGQCIVMLLHLSGENDDKSRLLMDAIIYFLLFSIYCIFSYFCLFKPTKIVQLFKLDKGFGEGDSVQLKISMYNAILFSIVVASATILISEVPSFIQLFYQKFLLKRYVSGEEEFDNSYFFVRGAKILIALLLIGKRYKIASFFSREEKTMTEKNIND